MISRLLLSAVLLAVPFAAGRAADPAPTTSVVISHAWSRATVGTASTGVVYLTVTDNGAPDRLTAASTPVAASAELHESKAVNGVVQMRSVEGLPVAPGKPVSLAPGGYHLMLMGLKQPLKQGDRFPLMLSFEHAGQITTTVTVEGPGASTPMGNMSDMHHM